MIYYLCLLLRQVNSNHLYPAGQSVERKRKKYGEMAYLVLATLAFSSWLLRITSLSSHNRFSNLSCSSFIFKKIQK
jgi:hypothetical protein